MGTSSYAQEAPLLAAVDEAFYDLHQPGLPAGAEQRLRERFGRVKAQADTLAFMWHLVQPLPYVAKQWCDLVQADALAVPNELGALLQSAGGTGLNASTSHDATRCAMAATWLGQNLSY